MRRINEANEEKKNGNPQTKEEAKEIHLSSNEQRRKKIAESKLIIHDDTGYALTGGMKGSN